MRELYKQLRQKFCKHKWPDDWVIGTVSAHAIRTHKRCTIYCTKCGASKVV